MFLYFESELCPLVRDVALEFVVKIFKLLTVVGLAMLTVNPACAAPEALVVNDASQVQFVANLGNDAAVFFRNFGSLAPGWLGCCDKYYIDLSTDGGKAQYATFLTAYFSKSKIVFYAEKNGGPLLRVGNF